MSNYIELRYFNDSKFVQNSVLKNDRTFPFLNGNVDYTASVVRFDCDNGSVPIWIPTISKPPYEFAYDSSNALRPIFSPELSTVLQNARNYAGGGSSSTNVIYHSGNFDINGDFIAMCSTPSANSKFGIWNHNTGLNIWWNEIISSGFIGIVDCKFSSDGSKLFVCSNYNVSSTPFHKVACYNASNGSYISQRISVANTNARCFDVHGNNCCVGCDDGNIYIYDVLANSTLATLTLSATEPVTSVDIILTPTNIVCGGNDAGDFAIWRAVSGYSYSLQNASTEPSAINTISISPDGQHIILSNAEGRITFMNRDGVTIYKYLQIDGVNSISWKRLDNATTIVASADMKNVFRVLMTSNTVDGSFAHIRNFYFTPDSWISDNFYSDELQTFSTKTFNTNSVMTDNNKIIVSSVNTLSSVGDHTNFNQINSNYSAPESWIGVIDDERKKIQTNLQIMIEYHHTPALTSTPKIARAKFIQYQNDDYSLIGYSNMGKSAPAILDRKSVLENDFFHCFSLSHFATLLQNALNDIFNDFNGLFTTNESVSCSVLDGKLSFVLPHNALDFDFRIIINQSLKNITGFHCVPHEYIPNAFVIVIKKDTLQNYVDGSRWSINELYRPTEMFPFKSLVFTADEIHTRGMNRYNNNIDFPNQNNQIITDLTLFPQGESTFYDIISYTPQSYNRPINIDTNNDINKITINTFLETSDGYQTNLKLAPLHTSAIMLKFDSNQ